jgi:hypothetical protein
MRFLIRLYADGKEIWRVMSELVGSEAYSVIVHCTFGMGHDTVDSKPGSNANPCPKLGKLPYCHCTTPALRVVIVLALLEIATYVV